VSLASRMKPLPQSVLRDDQKSRGAMQATSRSYLHIAVDQSTKEDTMRIRQSLSTVILGLACTVTEITMIAKENNYGRKGE